MKSSETVGKSGLASFSLTSPYSFSLEGDVVTGRLFGLIPFYRVHLEEVHFLRLATRSDAPPIYFIFNWPCFFMTGKRSVKPVYMLQSRKGQRIMMKLEGGAHFRLRQAIARHNTRRKTKKAA
jgi:hypothetical protein